MSQNRTQHPKAQYWINKGIFDDLQSFRELETRISALTLNKDKGDVLEIFVEAYLHTQKINQCVRHWIVGRIPIELRERYSLPPDGTGIDGIYETLDGKHVAYQVKYRDASHLPYDEMSSFLGIINKFSDAVIFTNPTSTG